MSSATVNAPLIDAATLAQSLEDSLVLDCRSRLGEPDWGHGAYRQGHIEGALFVDLDRDLAAPPGTQGRHPLPRREDWLATVRRLGAQNDQKIVVYDDAGGAFAARAWWMLRWLGHEDAVLLDGGLAAWPHPLSAEHVPTAASPSKAPRFTAKAPLVGLASTDDVLALVDTAAPDSPDSPLLLDARAEARWAGQQEPIDPVAGHIPGAVCRNFQGNLDERGFFKTAAALRKRFADCVGREVICYCGSGVTAAHNVLALTVAGIANARSVKLYADSWSGWITDPGRPVARSPDAQPPTDQ